MNAQLSTSLRRIGLPVFSVGVGILLVGAAIVAATLNRPAAPARHRAIQVAPLSRSVPIQGTGSAYDGGDYGWHAPALRPSPNMPIQGTGSVYDGGDYGWHAPALRTSPNMPIQGTGSVYDGGDYGWHAPALRTSPNMPIQGTGSAYDGQ